MQNLVHTPAVANRTTLFLTSLAVAVLATLSIPATAQLNLGGQQSAPTPPPASSYQGSVSNGAATTGTLSLTLDDAVQRGLQTNLGLLLSNTNIAGAKGQRLQDLQSLLPAIDASANEAFVQSDLAAEGLKIPGFPTIIGPFGYTDIRANLNWTVLNLN